MFRLGLVAYVVWSAVEFAALLPVYKAVLATYPHWGTP